MNGLGDVRIEGQVSFQVAMRQTARQIIRLRVQLGSLSVSNLCNSDWALDKAKPDLELFLFGKASTAVNLWTVVYKYL